MNNWTIETLAKALRNKEVTITEVASQYIDKIMEEDASGPNAVITLNPFWKEEASKLQETLFSDSPLLHGIPILIKDNIDTLHMGNSAGSIALKDVPVDDDAPLVKKLKKAGALILGKTNLSEWANFRSTDSTSGWSSLGGQTRNALSYDHNPSGSSSGSAAGVAANYAVAAIGTETDGSIVSPASHNGIVGLKPTVGRISRTGIIPISWSQDTAGPMTKTVKDAARLFDRMIEKDEADPATLAQAKVSQSFSQNCHSDYLKGKRIGYLSPDDRFPPVVGSHFHQVTEKLMAAGAQCIELEPVPSMVTLQGFEITQMTSEFPEALAKYIATRRSSSTYKTLLDFTEFNKEHAKTVMPLFKQEWFDKCLEAPPTTSSAYKEAQEAIQQFRDELTLQWFETHNLDAIVTATNGPAWRINPNVNDRYTGGNSYLGAVTGWPTLTVPYSQDNGLPLGALFMTRAWQEAELLGIGYCFEKNLPSSNES